MIKLLAISFLVILGLSVFPVTNVNAIKFFDAEDKPVGTFCKVEKADVCVLTMSEEDCTKLGGEKVDSCSVAEKAEDK